MIRINLLPKEYHKVEHTPMPRLFSILTGVAINAVIIAVLVLYHITWIPNITKERDDAQTQLDKTKVIAAEYDKNKAEYDEIDLHKKTVTELEKYRLLWTPKIDQFLSLVPDDMWLTKVTFMPEEPPKTAKKDPKPATITLNCQTMANPYNTISSLRKNLQGQINKNMDPDRRDKVLEFAKDLKRPLPPITGYKRVKVGSYSAEAYEWEQEILFNLRGNYKKKKKGQK
ncbi:PilN domain-containing protein [Planctomycetota bacterium]